MAIALSDAGAEVYLHGLNESEAKESLAAVQNARQFIPVDLANDLPASAHRLADAVIAASPEVCLLVCNAGTYMDRPFLEMDFATFERTFALNVSSQFALIQRFAQHWVRHDIPGRIVITGSINGRLSEPTHVAYDTSKGAIEAMVRSLAVSLAPHNIRVNGIAPGLFRTGLTDSALNQTGVQQWMEMHTPNGRVPGPEVIRGTTRFLLSDAAEHIHGQMIFVDGGMSIWQQPDPPSAE